MNNCIPLLLIILFFNLLSVKCSINGNKGSNPPRPKAKGPDHYPKDYEKISRDRACPHLPEIHSHLYKYEDKKCPICEKERKSRNFCPLI